MLISGIQGTPLAKVAFPTLHTCFTNRAFDAFMDHGRLGIKQVAQDMVDTFGHYTRVLDPTLHDVILTDEKEKNLVRVVQVYLMDSVVNNGLRDLSNAVSKTYTTVINSLQDARNAK